MKQVDKLAVITVKEKGQKFSSDVILKLVKEKTAAYGITKVELVFLEAEEGKSTYQIIKHYLKY